VKALRINRFLSQAGLGSRRRVEDLIRAGRIRVNGEQVQDLSTRVDPVRDEVELDGQRVVPHRAGAVFAYHKPQGVISSMARQGTAPCLSDVLPEDLLNGRFFHLGRLDRDSCGLLLLSDDGELGNALMHPSHPVWKRYLIQLDTSLTTEELRRFAGGGLVIDGRPTLPARIQAVVLPGEHRYRVELREGRKRQIRRMCAQLGHEVLELIREAVGPIELGDLAAGELRQLSDAEIEALREAAGLSPR